MGGTSLGLRTVIYRVPDLERAKAWYSAAFGVSPYFDQPYYVGYSIGGFELGLDPDLSEGGAGPGGSVAYWGVANLASPRAGFRRNGGAVRRAARRVDGGRVGVLADAAWWAVEHY